MKTKLRPLSSKNRRISISKKRRNSRTNSGSLKQKKNQISNSVSNNYFINNLNIGNLKSKISGNVSQHSALIVDMKKRLSQEKRKRLTVNSLVENSIFLNKLDKERDLLNRQNNINDKSIKDFDFSEIEKKKSHKKNKSFSFGFHGKFANEKSKSKGDKIKEILSKIFSNFNFRF